MCIVARCLSLADSLAANTHRSVAQSVVYRGIQVTRCPMLLPARHAMKTVPFDFSKCHRSIELVLFCTPGLVLSVRYNVLIAKILLPLALYLHSKASTRKLNFIYVRL